MTFSVTKSYLATVAGLAWDDGLIGDLDAPMGELVTDGTFASAHNSAITWHQLLQQRSEWEGEERVGGHAVGQAGPRRPP
jgi:CubicO group peptidase (beta-lactamase class C family)